MKGRFLRKALAAALALLVVSGNVPIKPVADLFSGTAITASAEESETSGQCGENATWEFDLDTGKLTISGTGAMKDYYYNGDQPWYDYKDNITSVEIEYGVTSIGGYAFAECASLTSVMIPDSVESIGVNAFDECTRLESAVIGNSVKSIGDCAFAECTGLTSIKIPDSIESIGSSAFSGCTSLESVTIPDSVTSISNYAFLNCARLTSITIPDSITSISYDAFYFCTGITDVYCYADPKNLTWNENGCNDFKEDGSTVCHVPAEYLDDYKTNFGSESETPVNVKFCPSGKCGENATWELDLDTGKLTISGTGAMIDYYDGDQPWYDYKDNITSVEIENGITSIGNYAFNYCTGLTSITIPDSVTIIGEFAFADCYGLESVEIGSGVASIGQEAFKSCDGLTSITIPDSVESIGPGAFEWCISLKSITIPEKVTSIGDSTFVYCESLESVEIGSGVESIGMNAFCGCSGLTSITIPASVTSIGYYAFQDCTSLTSITIPDSVTSISADAFFNCTNIKDVYCYADPANLKWDEDGCNDFMLPKNSRTTVCHVPAEYLDDYNKNFGAESETPVNVKFAGDLVDMGLGEHLYGHSITLDGSIGVNFYVELTDELLASETAEMIFTIPDGSKTETQTLLVKDVIAEGSSKVVIGGKTYYKFKCSVSAKDMASKITAQLVDGEKYGKEYTYSVKDYADYLLSHTEVEQYANAAPLVKAMLNYGAYSQSYFGEGTPLADSYKAAVDSVSVPVDFKYNAANTTLPTDVTFEGATLSLKSETTLSLYFKGLPENTTFTCNGKTVETSKNGKYVVARIEGIKANELENNFTVTFEGGSVTYNSMTYCYNVLNGGSDVTALQNVCKALYQYAVEASKYFG